jgi:hypothetical protein
VKAPRPRLPATSRPPSLAAVGRYRRFGNWRIAAHWHAPQPEGDPYIEIDIDDVHYNDLGTNGE